MARETGRRPAPYRVMAASNAMVHRIRWLAAIAVMATVIALAAACNNGGGGGATVGPGGGSAAPAGTTVPGSQSAPGY